ncbi:hypothetical protein WSM22_36980 [Cytophagales bacterium WSM2-2]|nr:hypothetical protein WSM22_36980 [Cytophagales bacterium WSM2-2]
MNTTKSLVLIILAAFSTSVCAQELNLMKAENHPMQYYVSLPQGWTKAKQWPVVVVLESASKEYKKNAELFATARGQMPFIMVAPINTNNGSQGRRDPSLFPYSNETWDYMEKVGDCTFNNEGLQSIIKEVTVKYNGEPRVYITGFEAGAHALWSIVFNYPELLYAAAPVAGNYRGRCVEPSKISKDPSRVNLPIRSFKGGKGAPISPLIEQWKEVKQIAESNGYKNISEQEVSEKNHEPMPAEVLSYFQELLTTRKK